MSRAPATAGVGVRPCSCSGPANARASEAGNPAVPELVRSQVFFGVQLR